MWPGSPITVSQAKVDVKPVYAPIFANCDAVTNAGLIDKSHCQQLMQLAKESCVDHIACNAQAAHAAECTDLDLGLDLVGVWSARLFATS